MPDIYSILNNEDFGQVVSKLCTDTMENRAPREYHEEYNGERKRRKTSVGWREPKRLEVYSDTLVNSKGEPLRLDDKVVDVARIVTNFPKKLVNTSTAMMFGGRMNISADKQDDGFCEFKRVWERVLGMQDILIEFAEKVMSETKAAIIFYPVSHRHWSGKVSSEINCKILCLPKNDNVVFEFYPHFYNGALDGFIHKYQISSDDNSILEQIVIWTREKIITGTQTSNGWDKKETVNPWGLIPIIYGEITEPIWDEVASTMDAREMRLSRVADTNDYFAEPILKTFGETNLPGKNTVGKEIQFPVNIDSDSGKEYHGDADFLDWQQSIDSVAKELDETKNEQYTGASLPDLSFDNLKGLGNLSGVSRRFMMLDAEIKQRINMRIFRPALNRCITVVSAGIANITNIRYRQQLASNWITVSFDSILPKDPVEDAQVLSIAGGGKSFNSLQTIVANSPLTPAGGLDDELKRIEEDEQRSTERNNMVGLNFTE